MGPVTSKTFGWSQDHCTVGMWLEVQSRVGGACWSILYFQPGRKHKKRELQEELAHCRSSLPGHFKDHYLLSARIGKEDFKLLHRSENITRQETSWLNGWFLLRCCIYTHLHPSRKLGMCPEVEPPMNLGDPEPRTW